jgi:hypothetical protein
MNGKGYLLDLDTGDGLIFGLIKETGHEYVWTEIIRFKRGFCEGLL